MRVWRTLPRFEGRSELSTWLYRVTAICLDSIKNVGARAKRRTPFRRRSSLQVMRTTVGTSPSRRSWIVWI